MQGKARADNTTKVYTTAELAFLRFCVYFSFVCLPVEDEVLAKFVIFQSASCSYHTLKVYLFGIRTWSLKMGYEWKPWSTRFQVYAAMQGLKRLFGATQEQKLAVSPALLLTMCAFLDMKKHNDVMLWAAMLVAFFGMFRKDNITVGKVGAFNPRSNLTRGDFFKQNDMFWIRVKHSKTNQFQERFHWVPLMPVKGSALCPVKAVETALTLNPDAAETEPMFTWKKDERASERPMTHSNFVKSFKYLVKRAGLTWKSYSGHSFRRGGATFAFNIGADADLIKYVGDWASDAYQRYEQFSVARRLELPSRMAAAVASGTLAF